jgi:hypothetical protein
MSFADPFFDYLSLMPGDAVRVSIPDVLQTLESRFGSALYVALDKNKTVKSPLEGLHSDTNWIKTTNTIGINVRTLQTFWNIVPYSMTLPAAQQAIHILPVWEPGVVASLYGPSSWNINPEFFSTELAGFFPELDTVEAQLKVVVNLLHLTGRVVGMDVVPHTDRFSEMVLANPYFFEWLQRDDLRIVRHDSGLSDTVAALLFDFIRRRGSALPALILPETVRAFFYELPETERLLHLFGERYDYWGRLALRKEMVELLYNQGFETVPATMGPPYRGIEVDPRPDASVTDEEGRIWRDYRITRPERFSRVFGPLARYKLYESRDDNRDWELDFERPNHAAWEYVCESYRRIQSEFNFDFMRGDMSHVQMRPGGVPAQRDLYYDLLGAVKQYILPEKPWFGYFAESFLAPPGEMAYGDELEHLEASFADSTLGDLQSEPVETDKFMRDFAQYRYWLEMRQCAPNFTIMTADKDDPRFDSFYLTGNEIRYFTALFLADMPSYMALGFECRDPHPQPAPNEHYTKLYVFREKEGPKSVKGPFRWGQNRRLYAKLIRQKLLAAEIWPGIRDRKVAWLLPPDPSGARKVIAWTPTGQPSWIFAANFDTRAAAENILLELPPGNWAPYFSTENETFASGASFAGRLFVEKMLPGEGLVFKVC